MVDGTDAPNFSPSTPDEVLVTYGPGVPCCGSVPPASGWGASVDAPLGAQMLLWEYATAVAGPRASGINPFDQPDVESAKAAAREMLDGGGASPDAGLHRRRGHRLRLRRAGCPRASRTVADAVAALLDGLDHEHGYLRAGLPRPAPRRRAGDGPRRPRERTGRPVTFGWGPRFLHSTGQYHKGGPATGVYLQVTGQPAADLAVPDRPFTFHEFLTAQAVGDGQVLADKGRPVLRLHVSGPEDLGVVREALT